MEQLMYRPSEAAPLLGMGRTAVFGLIKSGRLRSIKFGGARLITADALRAFVRELEEESGKAAELDVALCLIAGLTADRRSISARMAAGTAGSLSGSGKTAHPTAAIAPAAPKPR